jgi:glycosyltransferase involved in cell wall biosynthesis
VKIWILQTGEPLQTDDYGLRAMRAINLSNELVKRGHEVTLWSSDFDHFSKKHRFGKMTKIRYSDFLEIILIPSRGYKRNIGFSRLMDHFQLGLRLQLMMRKESLPDLGFIGYPPIEPAWVMTRFLKRKTIPTILDIKDAWPDVLVRGFPARLRLIANFLLKPYFLMMKSTFKSASYLSSISPEFLRWALESVPRDQRIFDKVNYLSNSEKGATREELVEAENYLDSLGIKADGRFRCTYIGSLTGSLDFERVFEAAKSTNHDFVIAGTGANEAKFKELSSNLKNVTFTGWVSAVQATALAKRSSLLIAPYLDLEDFNISLPNKFIDALMHGKPMVTSLSGYPKKFLEENEIGRFYRMNEKDSLTSLIDELFSNPQKVDEMGHKARKLFDNSFDGKLVYSTLAECIEEIVNTQNKSGQL